MNSKHAARGTLGVAHAKRNIALARKCNKLLFRPRCFFHISFHPVFSHAGNAPIPQPLGMRGPDSNVPSSWPERGVFSCSTFLRFLTVSKLPRFCILSLFTLSWCSLSRSAALSLCSSVALFFPLPVQERLVVHSPLARFFDVRLPHWGFGAVAPPVPAEYFTFRCGGKKRGTQV